MARRRLALAILAAFALLALGGGAWWLVAARPLSPEELALVGEWEERQDRWPGERWVVEYRPDRTMVWRHTDPAGGSTLSSWAGRWSLSGARRVERFGNAADQLADSIRRRGVWVELLPDGPNRYRYTAAGPGAPNPPRTGTLIRRTPAPREAP